MTAGKKAPRRQERVVAFKVLYSLCFTPAATVEDLIKAFSQSPDTPETMKQMPPSGFAWDLTLGVWKHQHKLDDTISGLSQNWRVDRMAKVELTLLRIAVYELMYRTDIPSRVAINEAIELSKQFGDSKSRGFVNGILDAAHKAAEANTLQATSPEATPVQQ